jgi:hypothetical protein
VGEKDLGEDWQLQEQAGVVAKPFGLVSFVEMVFL